MCVRKRIEIKMQSDYFGLNILKDIPNIYLGFFFDEEEIFSR